MHVDIQKICTIAREAGKKTLEIYERSDFQVEHKADNSPLTLADRLSNQLITDYLESLYPGIPILSEEGRHTPFETRQLWRRFWLVDPLDGTKEFIKRNGEFTVNIALLGNNVPVMGVIYAPVPDLMFYSEPDRGAFRQKGQFDSESIRVNHETESGIIAVRSRSHASDEEDRYAEKAGCKTIVSAGSSLKFCRVAEGRAHYYYRHGPTMEWDTAAGHAIALAAGALVSGLVYNKQELLNGPFLVRASDKLPDLSL